MRKRRAPVQAEDVLADSSFDERKAWLSLLKATTNSTGVGEDGKRKQVTVPDNRIRLAALKYLTDRRDGKAASFVHPGAVNTALQPLEDSRLVVRIPSRDRGQCKTSGEDIQRAGGAAVSFQMPIPDSPEKKPAPEWMKWVTAALLFTLFAEYFYLASLWMQQ